MRLQPVIQIAIAGASGLWLIFSIFEETLQAVHHIPWRPSLIAGYALGGSFNFMGTALLPLFLLLLYRNISQYKKNPEKQLASYKVLAFVLRDAAGILLFLIIIFTPLYLIVEDYYPFSVTPLITPISALLGLGVGYFIVRHVEMKNKLALLGLLVALVLAMKYVDWNPRKSLVRDMYRVSPGMTADEADRIMSKHKNSRAGNEPDDSDSSSDMKDSLVYLTPYTSDMVTVELQDGKVVRIDFSHD